MAPKKFMDVTKALTPDQLPVLAVTKDMAAYRDGTPLCRPGGYVCYFEAKKI